jgi:NDP-sugar pyrophosphorylase family protein
MLPLVILAGGLGTRLGKYTANIPKSLVQVDGIPFIYHQLHLAKAKGVTNVIICAGHLGDQIEAAVGNGAIFDLRINWSYDGDELLGTGGALRKALPLLGKYFMVMYGDSYLDTDYEVVERYYFDSHKIALLTVYRNENKYDSSNIVFKNGCVILYNKQRVSGEMVWIDYGLGFLSVDALASWPQTNFDLGDLYSKLANDGALAGYEIKERFYEIGSVNGLLDFDSLIKKELQ